MKINKDNVISQLKKRNPRALDFVVDTYGGLIHSIVKKILFNFENNGGVEECINDILLAVWNNIDKYNGNSSFKSWIAAISKYKSIDYQRKLIKELKNENIDKMEIKSMNTVDEDILQKENYNEIMKLLSNLKPQDREIFILKYFNNETSGHIAEKLNVNREVVNNRLSRGRKKLRKIIFREVDKL
ncbi:MAG: sigma-70 family RNA polymerase sigma factor [Clostridium sp.]|uniref:sigma-70 family RNA polymerase sigma factor n=2 Tax=Clostridium sp. TaxID=1506 RepID=UPI0025BE7D5D|nr:sigma-70 family RNA polymerase sigma factor [Clostridium sp.]MCH3964437.1 sigma-70 family RNA polymerase sigma factor [Clostridium sp.]MCI1715612.1 sigma-70 family RNA polymerase sigma factor [Clostridium sp.]MCI1799596.1 sigma-70 family RNA polymerase sigma factor [Clostridium sp.]MCI1813796.1 sigma-70 family RNA polymerase sigma factor [Clostridium sp.]MCI1870409.1 sigma-70 family RNA polymerase sigma factor [Clostridium sp.]